MQSDRHSENALTREVRELEEIADAGGSSKTPLILLAEVWVVAALALVVVLALALIAYRLAS